MDRSEIQPIIGYGKPPQASRFRKGVSGNPRGRPRGRRKEIPYDAVLGSMVTVRESGRERRVTAAEAFVLQLTKKGLEGCSASARASLESIENARTARSDIEAADAPLTILLRTFGICTIVEDLGMAVRLQDTSEDKVRLMLKPWIVEAAVARMPHNHLSIDQQKIVLASTRTPERVHWPDWWECRG